jgi:hypothetical protein
MKIIEGLKKIKDLQRKASDLRDKIAANCAQMSFESEKYDNQFGKVDGWLQAHHDIIMEIECLRERIAKTNLEIKVTIDLFGNEVTKSIHNWISRKRDLIDLDIESWDLLTDRGLTDQKVRGSNGEILDFKVIRFYNLELRDKKIDQFKTEKLLIDAKLEIVNAITDLIE